MNSESLTKHNNLTETAALSESEIVDEQNIPESLRPIFEKLEQPDRAKVLLYVKRELSVKHSYRKGPLPHPDELKGYNDVVPNGADRIMIMAENQAAHRIKIEDHVIKGQIKQSGRGQDYALLIAIICIAASVGLALHGDKEVAIAIGSTTIIGLVTVFITGKKSQQKDLEEKKQP